MKIRATTVSVRRTRLALLLVSLMATLASAQSTDRAQSDTQAERMQEAINESNSEVGKAYKQVENALDEAAKAIEGDKLQECQIAESENVDDPDCDDDDGAATPPVGPDEPARP